jgi:PAS domain S-box-containing protein
MNPAYLSRQIHGMATPELGARVKITSLRLINPDHSPDDWERSSLDAFAQGQTEAVKIESIDGQPWVRLMRPLYVEAGCLRCHGAQGYRLGEVRGAISLSIPVSGLLDEETSGEWLVLPGLGSVWVVGLSAIAFAGRGMGRRTRQRQRASETLRQSEERFRRLFEQSNDAIVLLDEEGRILDVNGRACDISGYGRDEMIGQFIHAFHAERDEAFVRATIDSIFKDGASRLDTQCLRKDGTIVDVELSARRIDQPRPLVLAVFRDITERKRA